MADLKKAIDAVEYGIRAAECAGGGERLGRSSIVMMKTVDLDNILELLKMREPKAVIDIAEFHEDIVVGICPSCGKGIVNKTDDPRKFCKFCGQAVKWND